MFLNILLLVAGLLLILVGANALTDGSSAVAKRFGISDLVVGLTVVAFGTSTPELVITVMSAVDGSSGLAIGNVVGSNIFNILAIIGVTAMVHPILVTDTVMSREIPMVIISSAVLLIIGNTALLNGEGVSSLDRTDGLLLIVFFILFLWYMFASARHAAPDEPVAKQTADKKPMPVLKSLVWIVGGLAMLVYGGDLFVDNATGIASRLGVSEAIIGLTIAAAGTSLPELATSVVAATKGKTDLAVGNVIGSNLFNIFMVLGVGATVRELPFGQIGNLDLMVLMGASVLFLAFGWLFGKRTFTRVEGALMFICYVAYITILCLKA